MSSALDDASAKPGSPAVLRLLKRIVRPPLALITRIAWNRRRLASVVDGAKVRVLVVSVYRSANAGRIRKIVTEARANDWPVLLWALDESDPSLSDLTVGTGPGDKFGLIGRLVGHAAESRVPFDWLVVADDDVALIRGSLLTIVAIADLAEFGIAQPCHGRGSHWSHPITLEHSASIARLTNFVEIGPLFAMRQDYVDEALAGAEQYGMGWGLDLMWSRLPWKMGIVDLVAMRHLNPVASGYSLRSERSRSAAIVAATGQNYEDARNLGVWRPWRQTPPWVARANGARP